MSVNNIYLNIITLPDVQADCYYCDKANELYGLPYYRISEDYMYACYDCYAVKLNEVKTGLISLSGLDPSDENYKFVEYLTHIVMNGTKFEKLL